MTNSNSEKNQEIKKKFIEREIYRCFSYAMDTLLKNSDGNKELPQFEDIDNLYAYSCPDCGEQFDPDKNCIAEDNLKDSIFVCPNCKKEYESQDDLNYDPQEIFEWWLVSDFLFQKLQAKGEPVIEWADLKIWGRCTTGQAILLDGVISKICRDMEVLTADE